MLEYPQIDPIIVSLGPLQLRWYSLMYVIGLAAVYAFCRYGSRKGSLRMSLEQVENLMVYGLVGMILGARFTYVFVYNFSYYVEHWTEILSVWKGGLSFHGAFFGIMMAILVFARQHGLSFLNITDHVCLSVPVGLGFGRIGNFINGELWGRVSDVPWAMVFPGAGPLPRHPSQLYESFLEGIVLAAIVWAVRILGRPRDGVVSCVFVMAYACLRFAVEFVREPDAQLGTILGPFSMGQILSALMFTLGLVVLLGLLGAAADKRGGPAAA